RRVLRRAECLFALIAIRHARVVADGDDGLHGSGMVGRLNLLRIPEDEKAIQLADYAGLEGPKRYFKNRLGGLGQYYFGLLRDLLLARSEAYHSPESGNRRASLTLALDLVGRNTRLEGYSPENVFLASAYTKTLANGAPWDVRGSLAGVQRGWATYEMNELL